MSRHSAICRRSRGNLGTDRSDAALQRAMSNPAADPRAVPWWERGVIYQIYPRSLSGQRRRRRRRPRRDRAAARLSRRARRRRDLAVADLPLADGRLRLRRRRLLRHRSAVRDARRFRPAARRGARARPQAAARLRPQPQQRPAPLVRRKPLVARQPQARLVHLARSRARMAARPTIGSATSAARPGNGTRRPANIISTPS